VLSGSLTVQAADSSKVLKVGDSARYAVDVQHAIRNTGKGMAKAILVVEHLG
jgi:quercetin dioxygenase-like cupin family protein